MNPKRFPLAALSAVLLLASCGDPARAATEEAGSASLPSPVVEPERPAPGESSGWLGAPRNRSSELAVLVDPWLRQRASAVQARAGLLVAAFEHGAVAAYAASTADPYRFGQPDDELPAPLWKTNVSFSADRLEILDGSQILAIGAGTGELALLSGADGRGLAATRLGSPIRFASASTRGTLALAAEDALHLLTEESLDRVATLPLTVNPAAAPASALGRFALFLMDGTLYSVRADATESWTVGGLDPRGGLACDGTAWYVLDAAGEVAILDFPTGERKPAPRSGPWRAIVGVDPRHLTVVDPLFSLARIDLVTGGVETGGGNAAEGMTETLDPDTLFSPDPEVRAAIGAALSKYRPASGGRAEDSISWRAWTEGAASGGSVSGPAFFAYRFVSAKSAPVRFSYSSRDGHEVLVAVFGALGEELVSNVGEHVDRATAAVPLRAGETYWIVSGDLGAVRSESAATLSAR